MPTLTIQPSGQQVEATTGESILATLKSNKIKITNDCGGEGECGSCHIFVNEGRKTISKIQREENEMLDTLVGVGLKSRLACQAKMGEEDVTIELLSFI
jgi:ferredoxin, 2Fe-2S